MKKVTLSPKGENSRFRKKVNLLKLTTLRNELKSYSMTNVYSKILVRVTFTLLDDIPQAIQSNYLVLFRFAKYYLPK